MKKVDFKIRAQWGYFRSAILGLAIGMLIAPGVSDLIREYNNDNGGRKTVKEKTEDFVLSVMDYFGPGEKVKVIINGEVVAIAGSESEGAEAYKAARLAYNSDGIKPLWVDVSFEPLNKESEADQTLLKEMKRLRGQELTDELETALGKYADSDKKLAYTMRIDDYIVTVEHFEDIISVLEEVQGAYDTNDDFRVGLKAPESKNVAMYEVEISEKVDEDVEWNIPDKLEDKNETIDGTTEVELAPANKTALTAGENEEGSAEAGESSDDNAEDANGGTGAADNTDDNTGAEDDVIGDTDEAEGSDDGDNIDAGTDAEETKDPAIAEAEAKLGAEDGIKYVGFSDRIQVIETYTNISEIKDRNTVYSDVTTPVDEAGIYVVVPGDTLNGISNKVGISVDKIKELNEGIEGEGDLYYDDRLNITVPTPPLEIMVEKQETYTERYNADVQYEDDGSMFIGETSVIQEGSAGVHTVTDLVTYKGNLECDRKHIDEVVEVPAVAEVVLRGTKAKPTYMFPVTNWNVTSNFGYRWGRLHAGTDVGVPQGTTVRASRGGQVVTAGWVGGYGNCVIIDHGDGVSTRYGHLSQVLVSVGQYVDQGDQIALSGNTGRSTGPHLHFEIRINGEAVDPLPYLYQ